MIIDNDLIEIKESLIRLEKAIDNATAKAEIEAELYERLSMVDEALEHAGKMMEKDPSKSDMYRKMQRMLFDRYLELFTELEDLGG